jgi:L-serine dehydratase
MRAARRFLSELREKEVLEDVEKIQVELYGSLAATGKGHATDLALLLGLEGETPEGVNPDYALRRFDRILETGRLRLFGKKEIEFDAEQDLLFLQGKRLKFHSNGMKFKAFGKKLLHSSVFFSVGGGFVMSQSETASGTPNERVDQVPYPFATGAELLAHCKRERLSIAEIQMENEKAVRPVLAVRSGILKIWETMRGSVDRGLAKEGILPGGLGLPRRAAKLYRDIREEEGRIGDDPTLVMEWVSLFALAVNEENAAGGRVVTAPTNGASGVIPAVLHYANRFVRPLSEDEIVEFFLTAAAIGILFKEGASFSAAEMGCQGEVGVACSMAAGALSALLGGSPEQVENGAEIGMEHNLGLTCDPVGGLVQIPCIERNTMGALKAINAARLALRGDGTHHISLDACIRAMKETGENMKAIYKETSLGGLALQVTVSEPIC